VGYSLYGSDIDEDTTPLEAGLEAFVNFDKTFVGKKRCWHSGGGALPRQGGVSGHLPSLPRHDYEIYCKDERSAPSPAASFPHARLRIGIGFVKPEIATFGAPLTIRHETVSMEATVVALPFYRAGRSGADDLP